MSYFSMRRQINRVLTAKKRHKNKSSDGNRKGSAQYLISENVGSDVL